MSLPKIAIPTHDITLPVSNKAIKFRPMLYKEEKLLLMAKQANTKADQFKVIKDVLSACMITPNVDLGKLPLVDIEFFFTQLRANSISNIAKVWFQDEDEKEPRGFAIDLTKITVTEKKMDGKFDLGNNIILTLRYPPFSLYTNAEFFDLKDEQIFSTVMMACMDKIFEGEEVHDCASASKEELAEFIENLPAKAYEEIQAFFDSTPTMYHEIKYTNKAGKERTIVLRTLDDFFMFG